MDDRMQVLAALVGLAEMYGTDFGTKRQTAYTRALLAWYPASVIVETASKLPYSCRFFPTVADFVEAIDGKPPTLHSKLESEALDAWRHITARVWDVHPSDFVKEVARDVAGTTVFNHHQERDLMFIRKDFVKRYVEVSMEKMREERQKLLDEVASVGRIGGPDEG